MLVVENISKKYGDNAAVGGISFEVKPGEIVGIIGPNGAGKTTLLKLICGLIEPSNGRVLINGKNVQEGPTAREGIGYVPEDSPVYDDMSASEYLHFFASLYDIPRKIAEQRITKTLASLDFKPRSRELGNLSKGMKRKVMIARSLLHDPAVLIYDEPASGLDPVTTRFIVDYIRTLKQENKVILFTGHNLFQIENLCDRILMLKDGKVLFYETAQVIKNKILREEVQIVYKVKGKEHSKSVIATSLHDEIATLVSQKATIVNVRSSNSSLEDAFLALQK